MVEVRYKIPYERGLRIISHRGASPPSRCSSLYMKNPLETKHPICLPKCYFEKFRVIRYHGLGIHNGLKETLNKIETN